MGIRVDVTPPRIVLENELLELFFVAERGLELGIFRDKVTRKKLTEITFEGRKTAFFAKITDGTGNEFLRAYEYEEENGLLWQVDFHLPGNSQVLFVVVTLINDTDLRMKVDWPVKYSVQEENRSFISKESTVWMAAFSEQGTGLFARTTRDSADGMELEPGVVKSFAICCGKLELDEEDRLYACVKTAVNYTVSEKELEQKLEVYRKYVNTPCEKLLYTGSGWGALEQIRRMKENLPMFPQQYVFPAETIGEEQQEKLMTLL